jgi:hypothetical protein
VYGTGAVHYTLPQGFNGPIRLNIDFGLAAPPESYYYASAVSLRRDQRLGMVSVSFWRAGIKEIPPNTVSIVLPEMVVFGQFWNSSRAVEQALDQQLQALGRTPSMMETDEKFGAGQTLYANSIFVSVGLGESCLDFYYLPPKDLHLARTRGADISLYPVVRVTLSQVVLKRLFDLCRPHAMPVETSQLLVEETRPAVGRRGKVAKSR